jgi:hypothetical protein
MYNMYMLSDNEFIFNEKDNQIKNQTHLWTLQR